MISSLQLLLIRVFMWQPCTVLHLPAGNLAASATFCLVLQWHAVWHT